MDLTTPQEEFVYSMAKYPALCGGYGSGKTEGGLNSGIHDLAKYAPHQMFGVYMPTYDLLKRRAIPGTKEVCNKLGLKYQEFKSDKIISIKGVGNFVFRSYDRPESIIAYETSHALCDELDTIGRERAEDVWRRINERNRGPTTHPQGNTVRTTTTTDQGYAGFMYSRWGKDPEPNYVRFVAPTDSNMFLPDRVGYIRQIVENYDELMVRCFRWGEFVSWSRNKVYHCFIPERHHTKRTLEDGDKRLLVSIDFNIGGCCATVGIEEAGKTHIVDEFVSHDTRDFCNRLTADYVRNNGRKIYVYPDASGQNETTNASASDLTIIRQHGFRVDIFQFNAGFCALSHSRCKHRFEVITPC